MPNEFRQHIWFIPKLFEGVRGNFKCRTDCQNLFYLTEKKSFRGENGFFLLDRTLHKQPELVFKSGEVTFFNLIFKFDRNKWL